MGNLLAYPITTSSGWSNDGYSRPKICSQSSINNRNIPAAKFYCDKHNLNVAFVYFPVDNITPDEILFLLKHKPSFSPTESPSFAAGVPTPNPSFGPTRKPSTPPTERPTPRAGLPTLNPSRFVFLLGCDKMCHVCVCIRFLSI